MKECRKCAQEKPLSEFYRDRSRPDGVCPYCKPCRRPSLDAWGKANRAAKLESTRSWREKNRERVLAVNKEWARANSGKLAEYKRSYRSSRLGQHAAYTRARKAAERRQFPSWANLGEIKKVYDLAAKLTRDTGVPHHVDHEIPLRGRLVSGLHVHTNLQVLTATANRQKFNHWPL